ncbi:MAG TPA: EF-hand domain-containing protein [Polyangiaceae bacterium]|nr:EF-hand domain-containing protein [Polyangiaceae bacterium]
MAQDILRHDAPGVPPSSRPARSLDPRLLQALAQAFTDHAGPDSSIDARDLQRVLRLRSEFLAQRMLAILDRNGDGQVSREEFMAAVRRLVFGSAREKLRLAFQIHDLDGNGRIEPEEIRRMIAMNLDEEAGSATSGVHSTRRRDVRVQELTHLLLSTADEDGNQSLCFEEFERVTAADPKLLEAISKNEAYWLLPDVELTNPQRARTGLLVRLRRLVENRRSLAVFLLLLGAANGVLFVSNALRYQGQGPWLMLAHGAGGCLNLDGALVLVPVMRRILNWLRLTALGRWLPIDDALLIHRVLGVTLFALGVTHSIAHFVNYAGHGGIWASITGTSAGQSGFLLLLVSIVMCGFSLRRVRKSGHFELFYYTHFAYIAWFALALMHGPRFYKFALLPLIAFAFEWLLRQRRRVHVSRMLSLSGLSSGVTRLELQLPPGFEAKAGDYAFLRIPHLARFEWHPFTISNAPGCDRLCFHIRSEGDWTQSLRQMADDRDALEEVVVNIDGPFGTPSRSIFAARHAVMIGAGIGVTPFASVLESMVARAYARESQLEKLYFFWLSRDSRSFEWFAELLLKVEQTDHRQLVDIQICMTGGRGNVAALALNLARNLSHEIGKPDWVTGLRTQTRIGAPDFDAELAVIAERHAPNPVDVFFCGPPGLGRKLSASCQRLSLRFHQEVF